MTPLFEFPMPSHSILGRVALAMACLALCQRAFAGGGPENVFLVVNANGPSSMQVANHYIELRKIPPTNVFYVRTPPKWNAIPAADFREKILRPVLAEIERRGLKDQIDMIVYSCEFPWYVDFAAMFARTPAPPQNRPRLSLTSATYFHTGVEHEDVSITRLDNNNYFTPTGLDGTPSQGFRSSQQWAPGGKRVESGGKQYLLSASLGFVQPDCNTAPEIIGYLNRAAAADGTKPKGTFYFMRNADIRTRERQPLYPPVVAELRRLGHRAEIVQGVVPNGKKDIIGLTTGAAHVRLREAGCQLMPGALVDNLTSQGGVLMPIVNPKQQTRVTDYLRLGAAGASGTIIEPYAIIEKFPFPNLHVHYARGCTMVEAFYQATPGPFQLLIVGDPLCRPFADIPKVSVKGLEGEFIAGKVEIEPSATLAPGRKVDHYELFVDGVRRQSQPAGGKFQLDTTALGDGYHELRVVAVDDTPVATQGRWIGDVLVKNGRHAVEVSSVDGEHIHGDQVTLLVASTLDGVTEIFHNERSVGRVRGRQGRVQLATARLGKGRVMLQARAAGKNGPRSRPLWVEID